MKAYSVVPFVLSVAGLLFAGGARATTRNVPSSYPTIQAAINASVSGDTILVADGTYTGANNKNLDYFSKNIVVMSANGPAACIIDCQNNGRGVYLHRGEPLTARFQGFTVKNGSAIDAGGGLLLNSNTHLTVAHCIFNNNTVSFTDPEDGSQYADGFGGGIALLNGSGATITDCAFIGNSASYDFPSPSLDTAGDGGLGGFGGGIFLTNGCNAVITNCIFTKNTTSYSYDGFFSAGFGGTGGGLSVDTASTATVTNCTFQNNATLYIDSSGNGNGVSSGGGISVTGKSSVTLTNSIVWGNIADEAAGLAVFNDGSSAGVNYTDDQDAVIPGTGNIDTNPKFVATSQSNLRLLAGSPCIDAGSASAPSLPPDDLDGKLRTLGSAPDMGAYEFGTMNTLMHVADAGAAPGKTTLLRALLRRYPDGADVSAETLTFQVDGTNVGTATTIANGVASLTYSVPANFTGSHTITAVFAGDSNYAASQGTGTLTAAYSTLTTVANTNGIAGQKALLRALLRRSPDGARVSGETFSFQVDGTTVGTAITDSTGLASLSYTIPASLGPGSHTITAVFAGDSTYAAGQGTATLGVQYNTLTTAANASGSVGHSALLRGLLRRYPDGARVSGETLTFAVDGTTVGTATTDSTGLAALSYTIPGGTAAGSHTLTVTFAGSGGYLTSQGAATLTVNL